MSKNFEVIGNYVSFGIGMVLKLSDEQAQIRSSSLKKQGNGIYQVLEIIHFKQGEKVTIVSGEPSKALLINLKDLNPTKEINKEAKINDETLNQDIVQDEEQFYEDIIDEDLSQNIDESQSQESESEVLDKSKFPMMRHNGFGKYDVFDQNGNLINKTPLKKEGAQNILNDLLQDQQNQLLKEDKTVTQDDF